jgi:hypothetical protein
MIGNPFGFQLFSGHPVGSGGLSPKSKKGVTRSGLMRVLPYLFTL